MRYCDEAIINCDNYGETITFDLAISGEKKETMVEKGRKTKSSEFILKSSVKVCVCVHRKSSEGKESQKFLATVGGNWSSTLIEINT